MPKKSIRKYLINQFYNLFLYQRRKFIAFRMKRSFVKKIKSLPIFKTVKKDKLYLKESKQFLQKYFPKYKNTLWHHYYSTFNNCKKVEYIPSDIFFTLLEPVLNKNSFSTATADKMSYDTLFDKSDMPPTVYKLMSGRFYDNNNNVVERDVALNQLKTSTELLVVKPAIYSGGGDDVIIDEAKKIAQLFESENIYSRKSYIIQQNVIQHKLMAQFNPSSVNTCRITTARTGSGIVVLSAFLRMGRAGTRVDNGQFGAVICGIDKMGDLHGKAFNQKSKWFDKHPDSGVEFDGFRIPGYKQATDFCIKQHERFLRFTFISWDIAISEDGKPIFIEFNLKNQTIYIHQILNGPLFGEHTEYFLNKYLADRKKEAYFL